MNKTTSPDFESTRGAAVCKSCVFMGIVSAGKHPLKFVCMSVSGTFLQFFSVQATVEKLEGEVS